MNEIHGIRSYCAPEAVRPSSPGRAGTTSPSGANAAGNTQDQVEISQIAHFLSKISDIPAVRSEKIDEIRQGLEAGTYDVDARLGEAISRLLSEHLSE